MAFNTVTRAKPPRQRNKEPAVHLYTVEHRRSPGTVDVRIRLTRPLMQLLGWSENQRVNVLVGSEEDAGTLKLEATPQGVFQFRRSTQSLSSYVITSRAIPLPMGLRMKAKYEIEEGNNLLVSYG